MSPIDARNGTLGRFINLEARPGLSCTKSLSAFKTGRVNVNNSDVWLIV